TGTGGRRAGRAAARVLFALALAPLPFALAGCRQDMQDQPRYEYYEPGDKKFFADGASSRQPVEGTVPRQVGEYRDREEYFFTGRVTGPAAGGGGAQGGGQTGGQMGGQMGVGAAVPNVASGLAPGALAGASTNVRGNAAGGVPGAREAAATGGPDNFPVTVDEAALRRGRERYQIFCSACHGMTGLGDGLIVRRGFRRPPSLYDDRLQEGVTPASHFFDVISNGWGAMPDYAESIPPEDRWKIIAYLRALQLSRRLKLEDLTPEERARVTSGTGTQPGAAHGQGGTLLQSPQTGGEKH
ncbi:MAG TPA: cytochrome c, partial [Pyrinomonadaceae bacterium]